jgi:hypothetical protein
MIAQAVIATNPSRLLGRAMAFIQQFWSMLAADATNQF